METLQEQKQLPKNYRFSLFVFYQILFAFVIVIAAMATYTAAKDAVIGNSGREFTDEYISIYPIGVYFASNGTI